MLPLSYPCGGTPPNPASSSSITGFTAPLCLSVCNPPFHPSTQPAISTSLPADSSGSIQHGCLLPRSLSAGWSIFKAAEKVTWACSWATSPTSGQFCADTSSLPSYAFTPYHKILSCRQSTLLTQLWTGACNLCDYRAHFESDQLMCTCCGEPETHKHFLLHCLLYALPRTTLLLLPTTQKLSLSLLSPQ